MLNSANLKLKRDENGNQNYRLNCNFHEQNERYFQRFVEVKLNPIVG